MKGWWKRDKEEAGKINAVKIYKVLKRSSLVVVGRRRDGRYSLLAHVV